MGEASPKRRKDANYNCILQKKQPIFEVIATTSFCQLVGEGAQKSG
jgi:hypothetical protein